MPPSLPWPDSLTPPNGVSGVEMAIELTPTMPDSSASPTAAAIGDALESGMVGVNSIAISTPETPFGGVKESGHGSEGGIEGLGAYLVTKFISQG